MAQVTLNIDVPDARLSLVIGAFTDYHGYDPESGLTRPQFAKQVVAQFIKDSVRAHRANQDADAARAASIADTDAIAIT